MLSRLLLLICALFAAGMLACFWTFSAEDSFIVFRYAAHLAGGKGLVFNQGEWMNAMTSPLHALGCALLQAVFGNLETANKIAGAGLLLTTWILAVYSQVRNLPQATTAAAVATIGVLNPCLWLWALGGLETPYLAAALIVFWRCGQDSPLTTTGSAVRLAVASGLCVLLRFDAVLFVAPFLLVKIVQHLSGGEARRNVLWLACGPLLVLMWLAFSQSYYHDFLPTSFYHKTPSWHPARLKGNAIYLTQFFILSGIWLLPVAASARAFPQLFRIRANAWATWAGIIVFSVYASTSATSHMMFAYRMVIPYLPVVLLTWLNAVRLDLPQAGRLVWVFGIWLCGQLALAAYIDQQSLNPGRIGEYQRVSRREYVQFMSVLDEQADAIGRDWTVRGQEEERPLRLFTYAAGLVSYRLPEATILDGGLISFRKIFQHQPSGIRASADYVMTISPRHGSWSQQLGPDIERYELVYQRELPFDGSTESFRVYFNAAPTSRRLPPYVDGEMKEPVASEGS